MTPDGLLLANGAPVGGWFSPLGRVLKVVASSWFNRQQGAPVIHKNSIADLDTIKDQVVAGSVRPLIDQSLPLDQAAEAVGHVGDGHTQGTTVITM